MADEVLDLVEPLIGPNIGSMEQPLYLQARPRGQGDPLARGLVRTGTGASPPWPASAPCGWQSMRPRPRTAACGSSRARTPWLLEIRPDGPEQEYIPIRDRPGRNRRKQGGLLCAQAQRVQPARSAADPRGPGEHVGYSPLRLHHALLPHHQQGLSGKECGAQGVACPWKRSRRQRLRERLAGG